MFGGIEAGGTKFVCAVGSGPNDLRKEIRFPTTTPEETLARAVEFFQRFAPLEAIGIASFGPVDLHPASPHYGYITNTPKVGWANADMAGALRRAFHLPIGFDTDVNAAALAEATWGAGRGLDQIIYLTIGTGIGGGALAGGNLVHGLLHPEMGHICLAHDPARDPFAGLCPFHGDCFEGLAAGPAMAARWGVAADQLPADHPAWELEADYIAQALRSYICVLSPRRIILGGGVMQQPQLFSLIRRRLQSLLNGYFHSPEIIERMEEYVVPPQLGNQAGVLGAIALAQRAAEEDED